MRTNAIRKPRPTGNDFSKALTRRNPRLSLRLPGSSLLRFADRQLTALLFHPPPRLTRFEPLVALNPNEGIPKRISAGRQAHQHEEYGRSCLSRIGTASL